MTGNKFIFDVDGTLTPSRQSIDQEFASWFGQFCQSNHVYLVTGSDYPKTLEQIGQDLCNSVKRIYNCNGNDVWEKGVNIHSNKWILPLPAHEWLDEQLSQSEFPLRTGLHFENRPGMVNFSIVGRNATRKQRAQYVEWDKKTNERDNIAEWFNKLFPEYQAVVGGETGLDISKLGCDKSQIIWDFDDYDISFFGDKMEPGGNDYTLAEAIRTRYNEQDMLHHVTSWTDTWTKIGHAQ